ncbi:MAG: FAD-dependent oxidoreductase [Elusimicrobiota bacterium]|jgi:NADPH-dependent glutamate synthase beta subunit-like oxidoreductase/dihydroorotate dehydrogenase/Pyruvate/2-oxoacid:ferredoxin oxidoreductase delta subunit
MKKNDKPLFLTDAQLKAELDKCEYCAEKPCKAACPADCSPADFIMAVRRGAPADYKRAAAVIMGSNPLGGICGAVCPDRHCMKSCVHHSFDSAVNIPMVQATIIQKAKDLGVMPEFKPVASNGRKVAVVGGGPAGWGGAGVLAQLGYGVTVFESQRGGGGMADLIPDGRLDKAVLKSDLEFVKGLGDISVKSGRKVADPAGLLKQGFDAVVVATGLDVPFRLPIKGEESAWDWQEYLRSPKDYKVKGRRVAVIGGGAVAADCAETAVERGAERVELFALETLGEMPLTAKELGGLMESGAQVTGRTRVTSIIAKGRKVRGLKTRKVELPHGKKFHPSLVKDVEDTKQTLKGFDAVIMAVGAKPSVKREKAEGVFYAGDLENGPTTVVEAVAAGKNAAMEVHAALAGAKAVPAPKRTKSVHGLAGRNLMPVPLTADFFGREIISPFLLSAAPPSYGYEQMKKAYDAGWAGGVMKTCFDNVPIHIPGAYMFAVTQSTYGNCDNVSGHPMDRVCREVERLRREYPDRLTMASTGGPVTGNDETDRQGWQANTKKLESCGVMGIEYSLSCPQGGDGTKGDIVSQDAELTAKIIDWVMGVSDPQVPKLFKLTAAVTAIYPIITAIRRVFERHPGKKAGVTLANTFPALSFRPGAKKSWDEGVVIGLSGEGVIPISNLTLANVSKLGVTVSGNGGPMDYKAAADFLALGAKTVQFCTVVMKHGYGVVDDFHSGLSHLLQARGMKSVSELVGASLPNPVTGFMELSPVKKVSDVHPELCQHCGNCTRCPYLAIELDKDKVPETDPSKCIGCSICSQKCFAGALFMRERTKKELELLQEA